MKNTINKNINTEKMITNMFLAEIFCLINEKLYKSDCSNYLGGN